MKATICGLMMILLTVGFCWGADSTRATYTDIGGTDGLTIIAVLTSQCTGTPPSVTVGGGATVWTFSNPGGGVYIRYLPLGEYHLFEGGVWQACFWHGTPWLSEQIDSMKMANWVTNTRMADNAVGSAEIIDASIAAADIGSNAVTTTKIAVSNLFWTHLNNTVKGTGGDTLYTIKAIVDTLKLMKGTGWNPSTMYTMRTLDSLMKKWVLNLSFTDPCSVGIDCRSQHGFVWARWQMNNVHNDSAVYQYKVWYGTAPIPFYDYMKVLDEKTLENLQDNFVCHQMFSGRDRTRGSVIPTADLIYVVVTAEDWGGSVWGSRIDSARSLDAGIGDVSKLVGAPGYAGQDLVMSVRDLYADVEVLKLVSGDSSRFAGNRRMQIYADAAVANNTTASNVNLYTTYYYRSVATGPPDRKIVAVFCRWRNYERLHLRCQIRNKQVGGGCIIYFDDDGTGGADPPGIYLETSTAADTLWKNLDVYYSVAALTQDTTAQWCMGILKRGAASNDTVFVRNVVVTIE